MAHLSENISYQSVLVWPRKKKGDIFIFNSLGNQICPKGQYRSDIDMLNAAQSGARSLNLDHQLSYLFDQLDKVYKSGRIQHTDWKLVTIFIGSNDICHSCTEPTSLPYPFGANVWSAVETIRKTMTNTLVQISKYIFQKKKKSLLILSKSWSYESTRYCDIHF